MSVAGARRGIEAEATARTTAEWTYARWSLFAFRASVFLFLIWLVLSFGAKWPPDSIL
jgi:hypothetical protein